MLLLTLRPVYVLISTISLSPNAGRIATTILKTESSRPSQSSTPTRQIVMRGMLTGRPRHPPRKTRLKATRTMLPLTCHLEAEPPGEGRWALLISKADWHLPLRWSTQMRSRWQGPLLRVKRTAGPEACMKARHRQRQAGQASVVRARYGVQQSASNRQTSSLSPLPCVRRHRHCHRSVLRHCHDLVKGPLSRRARAACLQIDRVPATPVGSAGASACCRTSGAAIGAGTGCRSARLWGRRSRGSGSSGVTVRVQRLRQRRGFRRSVVTRRLQR